jgi:hypothetical protein
MKEPGGMTAKISGSATREEKISPTSGMAHIMWLL